ncbi:MAG TPA: hypothetical protein PLX10_00435 [Candidatus Paceibacterota bacterium]|nr:hypothetical protein [Candidatus Paceibacterota bacterium]
MEGKTHYERIVGGTDEEKSLASKKLQEAFDERNKKLTEYEVEKTPEDLEILQKTEAMVDSIVARYGGEPKALPLDHIYILKPGSVSDMTEGRLAGGIHKPIGLKVGVEKEKSKLLFADILAHELFHLKSYKSARVGNSGEDVRLYRSGLSMIDKQDPSEEAGDEKEYFDILEEAIVAECTKKLIDEISTDSVFSKEVQAIRTFRNWVETYYRSSGTSEETIKEFGQELRYIPDPQDIVERVLAFSNDEEQKQAYAAEIFVALYKKGEVKPLERYAERKKLYELLDKLVINSGGKFKTRDEVFEIFARANFSGNYLPLARTVEGILGKGSFRKLAEEFSVEPNKG